MDISGLKLNLRQSTRIQLQLATLIVFILLVLFTYLNQKIFITEDSLRKLSVVTASSSNDMLSIRRHEKDFIARGDTKYITKLIDTERELIVKLNTIDYSVRELNLDISFEVESIIRSLDQYTTVFQELSEQFFIINDSNSGSLRYSLTRAWLDFHNEVMANTNTDIDKLLLKSHEKIYSFTSEKSADSYLEFTKIISDIREALAEQASRPAKLNKLLDEYEIAYKKLYIAYEDYGFDQESGLHGKLRKAIHKVENHLNVLEKELPFAVNSKLTTLKILNDALVYTLFGVLMFTFLYLTFTVTRIEKELINKSLLAQSSNKAKSAFLANMSHEIRTPLNGIIGMSTILSETKLTPVQKEHLSTVTTSSQTLLMLINDILDLSKIESGNLFISPNNCNLREMVYDTLSLVSANALDNKIKLSADIDSEIPYRVLADEHRLRQVLMNLTSNAVKFTKNGEVSLQIKLIESDNQSIKVYFGVKDTGIGIDKDKQSTIFEPFTQEDGSTTRKFGGTGLGLTISGQLVKLMGGVIGIDSTKGKGSVFHFNINLTAEQLLPSKVLGLDNQVFALSFTDKNLESEIKKELEYFDLNIISLGKVPSNANIIHQFIDSSDLSNLRNKYPSSKLILCADLSTKNFKDDDLIDGLFKLPFLGARFIDTLRFATEHKSVDSNAKTSGDPEPILELNGKTLLIVEDNAINQKVASLFLKKAKYALEIANNGQEAIDMIKAGNHYDAILMDCMMPIVDGFEATIRIRKHEESMGRSSTPIIALTASVLDKDIERCYDVGMNDYIAKPFQKSNLIEMVRKYTEV